MENIIITKDTIHIFRFDITILGIEFILYRRREKYNDTIRYSYIGTKKISIISR